MLILYLLYNEDVAILKIFFDNYFLVVLVAFTGLHCNTALSFPQLTGFYIGETLTLNGLMLEFCYSNSYLVGAEKYPKCWLL